MIRLLLSCAIVSLVIYWVRISHCQRKWWFHGIQNTGYLPLLGFSWSCLGRWLVQLELLDWTRWKIWDWQMREALQCLPWWLRLPEGFFPSMLMAFRSLVISDLMGTSNWRRASLRRLQVMDCDDVLKHGSNPSRMYLAALLTCLIEYGSLWEQAPFWFEINLDLPVQIRVYTLGVSFLEFFQVGMSLCD